MEEVVRSGMTDIVSPIIGGVKYTGPGEFEHLSVLDNLETYFKVQVFGHSRPSGASPYIYYTDAAAGGAGGDVAMSLEGEMGTPLDSGNRFVAAPARPERVLGLYYEEVIESEQSDQLLPIIRDSIGGGGDEKAAGGVCRLIFVLTDIHMYVFLFRLTDVIFTLTYTNRPSFVMTSGVAVASMCKSVCVDGFKCVPKFIYLTSSPGM
jgi:hypothetical protein